MATTYNTLILGASYGSLLAIKLLLAGHSTKLVCLPDEADLINKEGQQKVILRLSGVQGAITEPGFGWKIPILDQVETYDARLQYLNARPVELQIGQGEQIIVDYYVIWRIVDPVQFLSSFLSLRHSGRR